MMPRVRREEAEEYRERLVSNFQIKLDALDKDDEFYRVAQTFPTIGPSIGIAHKKWDEHERQYLMEGTKEQTIKKVYEAMNEVLNEADEDLYKVKKLRKAKKKGAIGKIASNFSFRKTMELMVYGLRPLANIKSAFTSKESAF